MAFGDADLDIFFSDMGEPIQFGSQSTKGNVDAPDQVEAHLGVGLVGTAKAVTYKTSAFNPPPVKGSPVMVSGLPYKVRQVLPMDDGKISIMLLEK